MTFKGLFQLEGFYVSVIQQVSQINFEIFFYENLLPLLHLILFVFVFPVLI